MATRTTNSTTPWDTLRWLIVAVLLIGGIVANVHFSAQPFLWRLGAGVGITIVSAVFALQTAHGKIAWQFLKDARMEVRRIIWPTRQQVMQSTLMVVVMVIVLSIILWGIDSIMIRLASWLTGQGG
ncbi:MAG: protein translocase subunit SecE [marine bacterium B5-7]|nr:MAG: protein translocase subunit SecE [marine bacterium B5-7]